MLTYQTRCAGPVGTYDDSRQKNASKDVHHIPGNIAMFVRACSGRPARQISTMIWNGNQKLTTGTNQATMAQPGDRR
jgi:hypothetical protein